MKKQISVFLIATFLFILIFSAVGAPASAAKQTASITVGGKTYTANVGSYVEYDLSLSYTGKKISTAQAELAVDFSALSGYTQAELDANISAAAPYTSANSVILRTKKSGGTGTEGYVMNFVSAGGYDFSSYHAILTLAFKVEKAGSYTLKAKVRHAEDVDGTVIVDGNYNILDQNFRIKEWLEPINLSVPQLSVTNDTEGLKIKWSKVKDAAAYRVFYKDGNNWKKLKDTTETSAIDKNVTDGNTYTYTVRCLSTDRSHFVSDYVRAGKKLTYHAAPKLTVSHGTDSVKLSWTATKGAAKYRVYYLNGGSWKKLKDVTSLSCTDTTLASGSSRTYTVRSIDSSNNFMSAYYPGTTIEFHTAPTVSLALAADGVTVSWAKITGAAKYRVFRKNSTGWDRLSDTAALTYTDKNVSSNTSYTYTVRCINSDGTEYTSDYRSGVSIKYYAAPKLTLSKASNGISIKWSAISGASKYRLYYKASGDWKKITDTSSTSYVDTSIKKGETRTYTARAMDANGNHLSWYYKEGFTITY